LIQQDSDIQFQGVSVRGRGIECASTKLQSSCDLAVWKVHASGFHAFPVPFPFHFQLRSCTYLVDCFDLSITLHQLDKKSQTPFNIVYLHYLAVLLSVVNLQAASHLANRSRRKQAAHHCSTTRPCSSPSIVLSIVILLRGHSEGLALSFNSRSDGQARDEEHLSSLSALLSLIFSYVGTDRAVSLQRALPNIRRHPHLSIRPQTQTHRGLGLLRVSISINLAREGTRSRWPLGKLQSNARGQTQARSFPLLLTTIGCINT